LTVDIALENGETLHGSNIGVSGLLILTAREIDPSFSDFRRWLADVSERTAPFLDFDLRGLSREHRQEFWRAAQRAYDKLVLKFGPDLLERENAYTSNCLHRMLTMHARIPDDIPGSLPREACYGFDIDFGELWCDDAELEKLLSS
jgi:hypothetical protein